MAERRFLESLRVDDLRRRPAPASAEGNDGEDKAAPEVCLDGAKNDRMAVQARTGYQTHAIGWLQKNIIPAVVVKW